MKIKTFKKNVSMIISSPNTSGKKKVDDIMKIVIKEFYQPLVIKCVCKHSEKYIGHGIIICSKCYKVIGGAC